MYKQRKLKPILKALTAQIDSKIDKIQDQIMNKIEKQMKALPHTVKDWIKTVWRGNYYRAWYFFDMNASDNALK